jgi:hypothetical protein
MARNSSSSSFKDGLDFILDIREHGMNNFVNIQTFHYWQESVLITILEWVYGTKFLKITAITSLQETMTRFFPLNQLS